MTDTSVLIVGGGPAGLSMAALLGRFGVDCTVVERRPTTNPHPRARSVNVRTTEILRQWGILDRVREISLPDEWSSQFVYTESLAGREIGRTPMHVQPLVDGVELSPAPWLLTSQDRLEPIIGEYAASLPSVSIRTGVQVVAVTAGPDGVEAVVRSDAEAGSGPAAALRTGGDQTITADWVIGADGASSMVRRSAGIGMDGAADLATLVNCHFFADLGRYTDHRPAALYWTTDPARNVFQKIDTENRWLCQIGYDPRVNRPEDFDRAFAAEWIQRSIGESGGAVELDVIDVIPWTMASTVAERFRAGRLLLIGDAAHQLPPSGGFGMNTAVQDAHNLAWKLAYVTKGWAGERLLDTYELERRPIARYNADRSLENTRNVGRIRKIAERGGDATMTEQEAVAAAGRYGNWLGMDIGLHYEAGCVIPDGTSAPVVDDPVADYVPSARPGHRAPHTRIVIDGETISSLDLYDDRFVLIVGAATGIDDATIERAAAERGGRGRPWPPLRIVSMGVDVIDEGNRFARLHGIEATGAVLVRPDGHVAWRRGAAATAELAVTALASLLGGA